MGLYQTELSRQIHLRNKQKREWDRMKKVVLTKEKEKKSAKHQELLEKEQKEEDLEELRETEISKNLDSAMVASGRKNSSDILLRAVDLLHNQNGIFNLLYIYFIYDMQSKKSLPFSCSIFISYLVADIGS